MKKACVLLLLVFLSGCLFDSGDGSDTTVSDRTVIHLGRYINDKLPLSTPDQDKAEIRALYAEINALDSSIRGTAANQATQAMIASKVPAPVLITVPQGK